MNFNNLPTRISQPIANKIAEVVSVFENGHKTGNYDAYVAYKDHRVGENFYRQITFGRFQTTEFGNLKKLIQMYIKANGSFKNDFLPYVNKIGISENGLPKSLFEDNNFVEKLKLAGKTDEIMKKIQEEFFEIAYFQPALGWFKLHEFKLPLSLLVIFDSHIHSGGIRKSLRDQFSEYPPNMGGDEKKWIAQYVATRHAWLSTYKTPEVRASKYRTQAFKDLIADNNWELTAPFKTQGVQF
jgi:chitosanase